MHDTEGAIGNTGLASVHEQSGSSESSGGEGAVGDRNGGVFVGPALHAVGHGAGGATEQRVEGCKVGSQHPPGVAVLEVGGFVGQHDPALGRVESAPAAHTAAVTTWRGYVGEENARWLATECRTARLAPEYRPRDLGDGYVEINARALGALRELGEEEDGFITDDGDGLRIWVGDAAFELEPADP
jgi:hypothetical protein